MKRENLPPLTSVGKGAELKQQYRAVFNALRQDLRAYPGGITAVADQLGLNATVLANKIAPDNEDHAPTAQQLLSVIECVGATRAVQAITLLIGHTAVPTTAQVMNPREIVLSLLQVMQRASEFAARGAADISDLRLDADEREGQAQVIDELIPLLIAFRSCLRS